MDLSAPSGSLIASDQHELTRELVLMRVWGSEGGSYCEKEGAHSCEESQPPLIKKGGERERVEQVSPMVLGRNVRHFV